MVLPLLDGPQASDIGIEGALRVEGRCLYLVQSGMAAKTLLAFSGTGVR